MGFTSETRYIGRIPHFVWYRDTGNLVIVVIDDECGYACQNPDNLLDPQLAILPLLREVACSWEETQAIGFSRLMDTTESADKVLELIDEWLDEITEPDTRVYFLVDVLYGHGVGVASNHTIERLTSSYSYPKDHIAYLTRAGAAFDPLPGYVVFRKAQQADYVRRNGKFRPNMMSFFGKGRHEDEIIDAAVQLYAQAWEASWEKQSWHHDCFEETDSDQLRALAAWLGDSVSIDDLYESPDKGESAKSLMIWKGEDLWEDPPWRVNDRRPIQGKVLKTVLEKLEIPFVPKEGSITMPCVPCFPFLVSLRNFLWRCEKEAVEVSGIDFFKRGENPQVNILRLMLKDDQVSHALAERFFGLRKPGTREPGALTRSLIDLIHCRTDELTGGEGRDYMRLFTEGTELPVVEVKIESCQINLIWHVG